MLHPYACLFKLHPLLCKPSSTVLRTLQGLLFEVIEDSIAWQVTISAVPPPLIP